MKIPPHVPKCAGVRQWLIVLVLPMVGCGLIVPVRAATCTSFAPGVALGIVDFTTLSEASGLVISERNPGVIWTHNDGNRKKVFALNGEARLLGRFDFGVNVDDVEDMAVGPGPAAGTSYLYFGDTGGALAASGVRGEIRIVRVPEPVVGAMMPAVVPSMDLTGVASFTLTYPDGSYDAETLLVDPLTADVLILTKQNSGGRLYRANLNAAVAGTTVGLTFLRTVPFSDASGGSISRDGSQILLRREEAAMIWNRTGSEPVATALGRAGVAVPVIGPPLEPNGEAIALLPGGGGYLTLSEGVNPPLYLFASHCPHPPGVLIPLTNQMAVAGGAATFGSRVTGLPPPVYSWKFNGAPLAGQTAVTLSLTGVSAAQAGTYELTATNASGSLTLSAELTVQQSLNLRLTELQSQPAAGNANSGDWWELTNFETVPVSLAGWRFNDDSGGLGTAFLLPAGLSIAPGESIVFVEDLTAAQFRTWWGAAALPPTVQVIRYTGNGLAFAASGDSLRVWNATTTDPSNTVVSVDFGAATVGASFNYNPTTQQFGMVSQSGVNGVFQAATATDLGSPGRYRAPAQLTALNITSTANQTLRLAFGTSAGYRYELEISDDLSADGWSPTGDALNAVNGDGGFFDKPASVGRRFYRIRVR